jgi:hypothetical protein
MRGIGRSRRRRLAHDELSNLLGVGRLTPSSCRVLLNPGAAGDGETISPSRHLLPRDVKFGGDLLIILSLGCKQHNLASLAQPLGTDAAPRLPL